MSRLYARAQGLKFCDLGSISCCALRVLDFIGDWRSVSFLRFQRSMSVGVLSGVTKSNFERHVQVEGSCE
jgi:hypothetical protein